MKVVDLKLPMLPPAVGRALTPYIVLSLSDNSLTNKDIPEASPVDGHYLRYSWYRWQAENQASLCIVHPSEPATLQCTSCLKLDIPLSQSFHCSTECFVDAWPQHRAAHHGASPAASSSGSTHLSSAVVPQRNSGETWVEVGRSKTYIPMVGDIGRALKFQCTIMDAESKLPTGYFKDITTPQVIPAPPISTRPRII